MKSCRTASVVATAALLGAAAIAACRDASTRPDVPPLTTARPSGAPAVGTSPASPPSSDASPGAEDAALNVLAAPQAPAAQEPPVKATFVDVPAKPPMDDCSRTTLAAVKGSVTALGETLAAGDLLVINHPGAVELKGSGVALVVSEPIAGCVPTSEANLTAKSVIRGAAAPKLEWANRTMSAHLDVGPKISPTLYVGRLEGTAAVGEHMHAGSWEILAAVEASGTFVLEGMEARLGPRQIVMVPPGAKHAWRPEPGSKLVAIQMYSPPGPEQRFVALAAADKDAGPGK